MNNLFLALFLISILALVVGLIKPSLLKQPSRKRVGIIGGSAVVLFFVLFGITSSGSSAPAIANTPSVKSAEAAATSTPATPQTLEQKITAYAPQLYGDGITFQKIEKQKDGSVLITLNVSAIDNKVSFRNHTGTLSGKIFQDAFAEYPSAPEVSVIYAGAKTDMYGKTTNGTLMSYFMTKGTFGKFNWANFEAMGLCDVLRQAASTESDTAVFSDGCAVFATDLQ